MKAARLFRVLVFAVAVWAGAAASTEALGNHGVRETAYVAPVATGWAVPTAYVYPTSYYYPTSYVVPTVYSASYTVAPTSYVVPTSYIVPSSYVVPTYYSATAYYTPTTLSYYLPTAWYEPTVAYLPTVVDYPVVTASVACDPAPTRIVRATPAEPSRPSSEPVRGRAPAAVESQPAAAAPPADEGTSSRVDKPVPAEPKEKPAPAAPERKKAPARLGTVEPTPEDPEKGFTPLSPAPADKDSASPPAPRAAERDSEKKTTDAVPVVPAPAEAGTPDQLPLNLPAPDETILRRARKPVLGTPANVLNGLVKSGQTGERVEGVPITLSSRSNAFADRNLETDAYGRFAVRLPDGDWDVLVTMPSGRVYTVSRLSVSNGKIIDDLGRNIPSLIITR